MSDLYDRRVHPTEWALVLADWRHANADVTIVLRGGVALGPGKLSQLSQPGLDSMVLESVEPVTRKQVKWTIDMTEIAAVKAVAP